MFVKVNSLKSIFNFSLKERRSLVLFDPMNGPWASGYISSKVSFQAWIRQEQSEACFY